MDLRAGLGRWTNSASPKTIPNGPPLTVRYKLKTGSRYQALPSFGRILCASWEYLASGCDAGAVSRYDVLSDLTPARG